MNRATEIVLEAIKYNWENHPDPDWWSFKSTFTALDVRQLCRQMVLDRPDAYDEQWFSVLCVNGAEANVDYSLIAQIWTNSWASQCDSWLAQGYRVGADNCLRPANHPYFTRQQPFRRSVPAPRKWAVRVTIVPE